MSDLATLTPAQVGIVKAAAAARFKELNVRPETADYIFQRHLLKQARAAGLVAPAPTVHNSLKKVAKLAAGIRAKVKAKA